VRVLAEAIRDEIQALKMEILARGEHSGRENTVAKMDAAFGAVLSIPTPYVAWTIETMETHATCQLSWAHYHNE